MGHCYPACNRVDCRQNGEGENYGKCKALNDTNFPQRGGGVEVCPFYKKRERNEDKWEHSNPKEKPKRRKG